MSLTDPEGILLRPQLHDKRGKFRGPPRYQQIETQHRRVLVAPDHAPMYTARGATALRRWVQDYAVYSPKCPNNRIFRGY